MKTTRFTFYDWSSLSQDDSLGYYIEDVNGVSVRKVRKPSLSRSMICGYALLRKDEFHYVNSPFGRRVVSESGSQSVEPPSIYSRRESVLTPDFKKRCAEGEIIMNPYYTGFGVVSVESLDDVTMAPSIVTSTLDWAPESLSRFSSFYGSSASVFNVALLSAKALNPSGNRVNDVYFKTPGGYDCPRAGANLLLKQYTQTVIGLDGFNQYFGKLSDLRDSVVSRCDDFQIDNKTVQDAAAKANSGDIDALTSIAEMPELIQSIIDGFKLLSKITTDARKKDFQVHQNSIRSAQARMKKRYGDFIARKERRIPSYKQWSSRPANRGKSVKEYHVWVKDTKENFLSWLSYLSKNDKKYKAMIRAEYATASAGVWLNYRYNIETTVMMLEDVGDTLLNLGTEFFRYRAKLIEDDFVDFTEYFDSNTFVLFEGTCTRTHRALIKRQYAVADAIQKLGRALLADVLVTAYEKIPLWSIIADWFFTITPFLKAVSWNPKHIQEKCSYSVKSEVHGNLHLTKSIAGKQITSVVRIDFDIYRRTKLTPSAHLGIFWNPDLSWKRQIDALAFLWSKQKGIYKNYYMS